MRPKDACHENKKYEKFIRSKPCIICQKTEVQLHHVGHARRNSFYTVPLCVEHHMPGFKDSYHSLERQRFEDRHAINLDWIVINQLCEFIQENE